MTACSKSDFKETQYISDPDFPGLPIYSEMGYNTFGAYINDQTFTVSYDTYRPFYLVADRDNLTMTLYGQRDGYLDMVFILPVDSTYHLEDYHSLLALDGKTFTIGTTPTSCNVRFDGYFAPEIESIYSGYIKFEKVQQVIVDKTDTEVVVSGKFQFRAFTPDGTRIDVTGGRFDLGVDNANFVNFRN
jgi:hypothetical protein